MRYIKGPFMLLLPFGALLLTAASIRRVGHDQGMAQQSMRDSLEMRSNVQQVWTQVLEAELGVRSYLLGAGPAALAAHDGLRHRPLVNVLPGHSDGQRARIAEAGRLIAMESSLLDDLRRVSQGDPLVPRLLIRGEALKTNVRQCLEEIQEQENRLLLSRLSAQQRFYSRIAMAGLAASLLVPVAALLVSLMVKVRLARRIRRIQIYARLLADEFPVIPMPQGHDEIAELGRALGQSAVLLDERQRNLRTRAQHLLALFEQAPLACHEVDPDGRITRTNQLCRALLGYNSGEIEGRSLWELMDAEQRDQIRHAVSQAFRNGSSLTASWRYLRKDGSRLLLTVHNNVIQNEYGANVGLCSVLIAG